VVTIVNPKVVREWTMRRREQETETPIADGERDRLVTAFDRLRKTHVVSKRILRVCIVELSHLVIRRKKHRAQSKVAKAALPSSSVGV
jgi:hypothetical protein